MKASLLDRSRTRVGMPDAEALEATVARAVHAEQVGYDRFWVAEHHAVSGHRVRDTGGAPGGDRRTYHRIRIGSGGVMLPLHQPLVVAEQFLVLDALHPGRVDLGLGRSLGFTPPVRRALRRDHEDGDTFEDDLDELRGYLEGTAEVTARPSHRQAGADARARHRARAGGRRPARACPWSWVAPSSSPPSCPMRCRGYRRGFRPHRGSEPRVTISLDVLVADDDATGRELALPEAWAMARSRQTGEFPPLESIGAIREQSWPSQVRRRVEATLDRAVAGSPATVRRRLDTLVEATAADELLASSSTPDRDALLASDLMLAELLR